MDNVEIRAFGEALGIFRTRAGLSQQKLANKLGMSRRSVAAWEMGENLPKTKGVVLQITHLLGLTDEETTTLLKAAGADPSPIIWHVPYAQNPLFTGREDMLHQLEVLLLPESSAASTQPQALSGLGGIGKTLTAVEYAYRHRQAYSAVLWLQADSRDILSSETVKLAHILLLPERDDQDLTRVIEAVKRCLTVHQRWLLILDNAEDLQMIQEFLPTGHRGYVLLTTNAHVTGPLVQAHPVSAMNEQEGVLFLLRRTEYLPHGATLERVPLEHYHNAQWIWQLMEGLPLALDQAGAYILETGCSFSDYLAIYQHQRTLLLRKRGNLFSLEHPRPVTTTFLLSFKKVEQLNVIAAELLRACAFLYAEAIPEDVILEGAAHLGSHLAPIAKDRNAWNEAIAVLRAYSLIRRDVQQKMFSVHRLVQIVIRDEMDDITQQQWAERVVRVIAQKFPFSDVITWSDCEVLFPHALVSSTSIVRWDIVILEAAILLNHMGKYLVDLVQYNIAESFFRRALAICEQILESNHAYTVQSLNYLAVLYRIQGKHEVAEPLFQRALAMSKHIPGPDNHSMALLLINLALLYNDQGEYEKAEPLYRQALAIYERVLEPDHPDMALLLNNLAVIYADQERYEEAEPLYQQALAIRERVLGAEHPDIAQSLNNLANLFKAQDKYEQAEPLYQRALSTFERVLRPDHSTMVACQKILASLYEAQGRYGELEVLYKRTLTMREQVLGPHHPGTATSLNTLAVHYTNQEKYVEAEPLFQRALAIRAKELGPEYPGTVQSFHNLALLYEKQGRNKVAESLYHRVQVTGEQIPGPNHPL